MGKQQFARSRDRIDRLQQALRDAKAAGDEGAEIAALLAIGEAALADGTGLAFFHFRLAEKVIRASGRLERLHEALGQCRLAGTRCGRNDEEQPPVGVGAFSLRHL